MELNDVRELLAAPIPCKWKPEITTKKGPNNTRVNIERSGQRVAGCTAHIDARQVMDVLDAVVGPGNWSDSYQPSAIGVGVECTLTVLGVSKTDVGMPSSQDAEKGAYSDALKRAAVKFGIGRFLYDMEIQWLPFDGFKVTQKPVQQMPPQQMTAQELNVPTQPGDTFRANVDKGPLPDDEQVIYETEQSQFFVAATALIDRYNNEFATAGSAKKLGYATIPKGAMKRVEMYREIRAYAAHRDGGMDGAAALDAVKNEQGEG